MIALPPAGVATESVLDTASPPAAVIARTTPSAGVASSGGGWEASLPPPRRLPPGSLTTTFAPCDASKRAYERPNPRPPPVTTATRPSNLRSPIPTLQGQPIEVACGAPIGEQFVECV